jgi:hypothetical protein
MEVKIFFWSNRSAVVIMFYKDRGIWVTLIFPPFWRATANWIKTHILPRLSYHWICRNNVSLTNKILSNSKILHAQWRMIQLPKTYSLHFHVMQLMVLIITVTNWKTYSHTEKPPKTICILANIGRQFSIIFFCRILEVELRKHFKHFGS